MTPPSHLISSLSSPPFQSYLSQRGISIESPLWDQYFCLDETDSALFVQFTLPILTAILNALEKGPGAVPRGAAEMNVLHLLPSLHKAAKVVAKPSLTALLTLLARLVARNQTVFFNNTQSMLRPEIYRQSCRPIVELLGATRDAAGYVDAVIDSIHHNQLACLQCGKHLPEAKFCTRCRDARYCSVECQKTHWRAHKARCAKVRSPLSQFVLTSLVELTRTS